MLLVFCLRNEDDASFRSAHPSVKTLCPKIVNKDDGRAWVLGVLSGVKTPKTLVI